MVKKLLVFIFLLTIITGCSNSESGRIEIYEPFSVEMSTLGRINGTSVVYNYNITAPNIGGSLDAINYTKSVKNNLVTLTNNIINLDKTEELALVYSSNYQIINNRQLRYLSIVTTSLTTTNGHEEPSITVTTFRTNNGRKVRWQDVFTKAAQQSLSQQLTLLLQQQPIEGHHEQLFNNLEATAWHFNDDNLVFSFNTVVVDNKVFSLSIPISFLRSERLLR